MDGAAPSVRSLEKDGNRKFRPARLSAARHCRSGNWCAVRLLVRNACAGADQYVLQVRPLTSNVILLPLPCCLAELTDAGDVISRSNISDCAKNNRWAVISILYLRVTDNQWPPAGKSGLHCAGNYLELTFYVAEGVSDHHQLKRWGVAAARTKRTDYATESISQQKNPLEEEEK